MKTTAILLFASMAFLVNAEEGPKPVDQSKLPVEVHVTDPKPDVKELPKKNEVLQGYFPEEPVKRLNEDEIQYVKDLFRNAVLDAAVNLVVVANYTDSDGKQRSMPVSIMHPQNSPVVKFVCSRLFRDQREMEQAIYGQVYAAVAATGQHALDVLGERNFLKSKLNEKCKDDPKFFADLVAVVKEAVK